MVLVFKNDVVIIYEKLMDGALKIKARKCACIDSPKVQIDNNIIFILYLAYVNLILYLFIYLSKPLKLSLIPLPDRVMRSQYILQLKWH